jgi:hypothetical protein
MKEGRNSIDLTEHKQVMWHLCWNQSAQTLFTAQHFPFLLPIRHTRVPSSGTALSLFSLIGERSVPEVNMFVVFEKVTSHVNTASARSTYLLLQWQILCRGKCIAKRQSLKFNRLHLTCPLRLLNEWRPVHSLTGNCRNMEITRGSEHLLTNKAFITASEWNF